MRIYVAGYTRDSVLRTFSNLPREYKSIVTELQMEKLSEGIRDGFLWRVHSNKMYSCTLVSSLWDKKLDERRIPLIVSFVMDKDAAEFIMESPLRLLKVTEQLKRIEREDVIHFSNADVMDTWDDDVKEEIEWDVVVDSSKVAGIVQAVVKREVEKEVEFAGFVYEAKAEIFAALDMLPMAFRLNFSFSFPFAGCGAAVCDINMTDRETMQHGRDKSYSGWPMIQRITVSKELDVSEKTVRVFQEIQRLYQTYGKIPLRDRDAEVLVRRLELLSYLNEYNAKPTKTVKKVILKNKSKKLKIDELLKLTEHTESAELLSLLGKNSSRGNEKQTENTKENKIENKARDIKVETVLLTAMILLTTMTIFVFRADMDMKTVYLSITFETETLMKYILVFLSGLFTGIFAFRIGGARKEKK